MRIPLALLVVAATGASAFAAPPEAGCPPPRLAWLPGGVERVTRSVPVPAVLTDRYVPVYEVVTEPILEFHDVPKQVARQAPVYELREVPVFEKRRTPVVRDVTVPVYAYRAKPVLGPSWTCSNEERLVPWWHVNEKVQSGVTTERRVVGYREEQVRVGTATQRVQSGWRTEYVPCGTQRVTTVVGTRQVRRCIGWRTETIEAAPAGFKQVCERVERPGRWVTLSDAPVRPAPLPGSDVTLTGAEYAAALAQARR